jgi:Leucine-rich repeat (LRR) protein
MLKYKNLKSLYLHGNQIADINEVARHPRAPPPLPPHHLMRYVLQLLKLRQLPLLKSLAMHGNPCEEIKNPPYRLFVIGALPNLCRLDFCTITPQDREEADLWFDMRLRQGMLSPEPSSPA